MQRIAAPEGLHFEVWRLDKLDDGQIPDKMQCFT